MPYDVLQSIQLRKITDPNYLDAAGETDGIDAMAETCLRAHEAVKEHGTPEMQATMRILLFQIGQEIARQKPENREKRDGA